MNRSPLLAPSRLRSLADPRALLLLAILLAYVLWPILLALIDSFYARGSGFTLDPWRQFIQRGHYVYAFRSLGISVATVALSGVFGTALAFVYERLEFPGRRAFAALALLPFTLPPLVGVFAIWSLMAEDGAFHQLTRALFGKGFWIEKGYSGVLLVHVYSMYVYFFVMVGGALASFDESQIEAARNLGATRRQALFRVVLPQLLPAFAGASLLTFMTSMASFTAPFYYMAGRPALTVGIKQALDDGAEGLASADCVALVACAAVFLWLVMRFERAFEGGAKGIARRRAIDLPLAARLPLTVVCGALTLLLVAPHLAMLRESLIRPGTGFVGKPIEYTLANYPKLFREAGPWRPMAVSLQASAVATAAVLLFALLSAWMETRRDFAGKGLMRALVMLPWALPGTVIGIGLLWITREPGPLTFGLQLRGTVALLALAYFIRLLPLAHRTIKAGLARAPAELERAARNLGATPLRAFTKVTLPLIAGAVVAAGTLAFVTAMGEFVSSILLYGPGTEPISVKIDQLRRGPAGMQAAAAYSTILTLLIAATFLLFGRGGRRGLE